MHESEDFYMQNIAQVRVDCWSSGRVTVALFWERPKARDDMMCHDNSWHTLVTFLVFDFILDAILFVLPVRMVR